jgi:proton-coupled amino acid transporter
VILPVESAMEKPEHFKKVFVSSMTFTAMIFATVGALCCIAFGDVTNGSVTAFLVEKLNDEGIKWWLYMANTAVSVAVLLTYPLQLFPSFELIGPWLTRVLRLDIGTEAVARRRNGHNPIRSFSPVPSCENPDDGIVGDHEYHDSSRISTSTIPNNNATATVVGNTPLEAEEYEYDSGLPAFFAGFPTPGDSPQLRAILVCFTYILAIAIPNVQLLVSLAGALSGSATGLIIPPLLELSYVKRQIKEVEDRAPANDIGHDNATRLMKLKAKKVECYVLSVAGSLVCLFGTGAALADIARVYMGP